MDDSSSLIHTHTHMLPYFFSSRLLANYAYFLQRLWHFSVLAFGLQCKTKVSSVVGWSVRCFCERLLKVLGMGWVGLCAVPYCTALCCTIFQLFYLALVSNQVGEFNQLIRTELIRRCVLAYIASTRMRTHFRLIRIGWVVARFNWELVLLHASPIPFHIK